VSALGNFDLHQLFEQLARDQRCLVAFASMSFSCAATARRPIRSNCSRRLSLGFIIVASVGKLIVGLQVVWADIKVLSLGMATQIKRHRHSVIRLTQQEGHRSGARRVALKRFVDGAAHRPRAIAIEQHEQCALCCAADSPSAKARSNRTALSGTASSRRPLRVDSRALRLVRSKAC